MGERKQQHFFGKYGPWALIAGSAQGMGEAYAETFAANGLNLVLLDRDGSPSPHQANA